MKQAYDGLTTYQKKAIKDRLKIEWIYTSNAIEGNSVSLGDTAFIVEEGLTVSGVTLREHEEVVGHARAVDIIYDLLNKDEFTEEDLFKLHKAVQTSLVIDIFCPIAEYKVEPNGRYIKIGSKKVHHYYPSPTDTKHLMKLWFSEFSDTTKEELTLEKSIKKYTRAHLSFTAIHPFFDGNGRLARLLSNIYMLKNGYLPLLVSNKKREKYIELLSQYNLNVKELNINSTELIEESIHFEKLYEFFILEYNNSKILLDELKGYSFEN
ncbi:MAG: Fic family protein [Helicobacteraceae bacterium]|nr:Fic family protein [Helicobacteraceae bacterium]